MAEAAWSVAAACQGGVIVDESGDVGAPGRCLWGRACPATLELGHDPDLLGYEDHLEGEDTSADARPLLGQTRQRISRALQTGVDGLDYSQCRWWRRRQR